MSISADQANAFISAYSLIRRTGILQTSVGRRLFKSAYFLYKHYVEDDLQDLVSTFPQIVGSGDVLDIGANIGYTATVLAKAAKRGRTIFAFEPEPFNFRILQQTALRRRFEGKIIPLQLAVGAESGTIDLWINDRHHADHRIATEQFRSAHSESKQISVSMVSVDSFLANKTAHVSFVKIDVQGYELAVCQGMQNMLRQNPDATVVLEFMPSAMRELGFEPSQLIDFFAERGFNVYQVLPRGKLLQGMPPTIKESSYIDLLFSRNTIAPNRKTS